MRPARIAHRQAPSNADTWHDLHKPLKLQGTILKLGNWHGFRNVIAERCAAGMAQPDDGVIG
jgi:hypothetical protein